MLADTDRARDALQAIPPDLPRDEWVRAGMAAHAAGLPFDEFDAWSAAAGNYDARAARDTWRSFKDGKGLGPGTLFKMAAQAGWTPEGRQPRNRPAKATTRPVEPTKPPRPGMGAAEVWGRCRPASDDHGAHFSDRGRLFQADRGRRFIAIVDARGLRASEVFNVSQSSTISLKRGVGGPLSMRPQGGSWV